ncbi:hypothetical protein HOLleu_22914 [Holothuria leucospilota]|uniref:Uncharacterized protein n=1 Tax=Holothuria leucospilota TaxID=206669 RepID=A0A9Q1H4S0_HOLLE|nr:hypothetical protein HOLleu_22914 [Holothuria leucospilota]
MQIERQEKGRQYACDETFPRLHFLNFHGLVRVPSGHRISKSFCRSLLFQSSSPLGLVLSLTVECLTNATSPASSTRHLR